MNPNPGIPANISCTSGSTNTFIFSWLYRKEATWRLDKETLLITNLVKLITKF
jgi:hypothetical protein